MASTSSQETVDCGDLDGFVAHIFSTDPRPPNTVALDITGDSPESVHDLFVLLVNILVRGMAHKFGAGASVSTLSAGDVVTLKKYVQSMGYDVWVDEEIDVPEHKAAQGVIPHILKQRHCPGSSLFHRIQFCRSF